MRGHPRLYVDSCDGSHLKEPGHRLPAFREVRALLVQVAVVSDGFEHAVNAVSRVTPHVQDEAVGV